MMLEDIKVSDFPKNPMPVPEHVKNWKLVWEKVPPSQEKLVVRGLLTMHIFLTSSVCSLLGWKLIHHPISAYVRLQPV